MSATKIATVEAAEAHVARLLDPRDRARRVSPSYLRLAVERCRADGRVEVATVYARAADALEARRSLPKPEPAPARTREEIAALRALGLRRRALALDTPIRLTGATEEARVFGFDAEGNPLVRSPTGAVEVIPFGRVQIKHNGRWI